MMHQIKHLLVGSYAGIFITVVGGFILQPAPFLHYSHSGLSFYGNYFPTAIPFVLGLFISAVCLAMAALSLPDGQGRLGTMRRLLLALSGGFVVIVLTPVQANVLLYWAHTFAAIYLFAAGAAGALWAMSYAGRTVADWFFFGIFVLGFLLSFLSASFVHLLGFLALGQVLALNGGALVLFRVMMRWTAHGAED